MAEEFIERPRPKGPAAAAIAVLQASLIALVVGYVLDLHRSLLKLNLYTDQFLLVVLGFVINRLAGIEYPLWRPAPARPSP